MHEHSRPLFFPITLAVLTLCLVVFMVAALSNGSVKQSQRASVAETAMNEQTYQSTVADLFVSYTSSYSSALSDVEKLALTQQTLNALLEQRVPAVYKDAHLQVAVALHLIAEGLREQKPASRSSGEERLTHVQAEYPWLTKRN